MNKVCGIYCIKNKVTGKLYVGQSINVYLEWNTAHKPALKYNRHHNVYLQREYNIYGKENFEHKLIIECDEKELDLLEIYYIKKLKSHYSENGYNLSFGGESVMRGRNHTEETKRKMSNSKKNMSDETKKKIGQSVIGRKRKTASSDYYGVSKRTVNKNKNVYWRAAIFLNKEYIHIGNFKSELLAALAYNEYVIKNSITRPLNIINKMED